MAMQWAGDDIVLGGVQCLRVHYDFSYEFVGEACILTASKYLDRQQKLHPTHSNFVNPVESGNLMGRR